MKFPFDLRDPAAARDYFIERATWRKINYVSKQGDQSHWVVHPEEDPHEALKIISSFIAKHEGHKEALEVAEWTLTAPFFTKNGKQRKMILKEAPEPASGYLEENTVDLSEVITIKELAKIVNRPENITKTRKNWRCRQDEWRISEVGNKRPASPRSRPLPRFMTPYELHEAWATVDTIKNEFPYQFWDGINEEELLGGVFWTNIAVEKVLQNAAEEQANYEQDGRNDADWLTDLFDRGMRAMQEGILALDHETLTPKSLVEQLRMANGEIREQAALTRNINGWALLQNNSKTAWTQEEPKNRLTWLCDILGNWEKEATGLAASTPLSRMLSTMALALTFNQAQNDVMSTREGCGGKYVNQVSMQWHANFERISSKRFLKKWVARTLKSLDEPEETAAIKVIGQGEKHVLIWSADRHAPKLWLLNYGGRKNAKTQHDIS